MKTSNIFTKLAPLFAIALALFATQAQATLWQSQNTTVTALRVEGGKGYITFAYTFSACTSRLWVDLATDEGKAFYFTATTALALEKTVIARAHDTDPYSNGACKMYDLFVF